MPLSRDAFLLERRGAVRRKIRARTDDTMSLNSIQEIIDELKAGRMAVLVDDDDRENEGDLIFAAEFVPAEKINFMAKFGRGLVCMPITEAQAERLNLLPMGPRNRSLHGSHLTASIADA